MSVENLTISVDLIWKEKPLTEIFKCDGCKDLVVTDYYHCYALFHWDQGDNHSTSNTPLLNVCSSCYQECDFGEKP